MKMNLVIREYKIHISDWYNRYHLFDDSIKWIYGKICPSEYSSLVKTSLIFGLDYLGLVWKIKNL